MTAPVPARCLACSNQAPARQPICARCRRTLEHVCYGKVRHFKGTAKGIEERERQLAGRENTRAYDCPVCQTWHTARTSLPGEATHADAVLICLRLRRFHGAFLDGLGAAWSPTNVDRAAWRALASPNRFKIAEEVPGADNPCPAPAA